MLAAWISGALVFASAPAQSASGEKYPDRFVWVFGWSLDKDSDVAEVSRLIETGADHGLNGAVVSFGLDSLCKKDAAFFQRLESVRALGEKRGVELIPSAFSIGYGGGILAHDRNLAEGLPVVDAPFRVRGDAAFFELEKEAASPQISNGGFEAFEGNRFKGFGFHDQPGEVSFADATVKHSGRASLRLENFTANPHGHGRVSQEVSVRPHRCYRATLWVKTQDLAPLGGFQVTVLAAKGDRNLAPRQFDLAATADWRKLTLVFNSAEFDRVRLYAGMWGGRQGKLWIDDWALEEIGPFNVLNRPGTPVVVRSEDGQVTYVEGRDYAPLRDPNLNPYRVEGATLPLRMLPGGRIPDGSRLRVSWYHSMLIHDSQVTLCMGEPAVYDIIEHEMKLLAERLRPKRMLLNMDEVRMGGTCRACAGRNLAELLGECITRQTSIIRKYAPGAAVYIWSDMLDPNHNARGNYYLAKGDYTASWNHVPNDLVIAVWGGEPRPESLRFFADRGFETLVACYYDAADLSETRRWLEAAKGLPRVRGFMYTPWTRQYDLLPAFGALLR